MCLLIFIKFLFHLKSSSRSRDIRIFVFPSSPLFHPVNHCFRVCSKINLNVYDVISSLNKNLITHFVWYLEKQNRYGIETLSIDRVLNKEQFYENIMQKMCTKSLMTDSFLTLVNNPKQLWHAKNSFKNKIFWKKIIKKL